jgi:hypothetical protein
LRVPFNQHFDLHSHTDISRNAVVTEEIDFADEEGKGSWCPIKGACNGRAMRGIVCIVAKDEQRFKLIDLAGHDTVGTSDAV